MSLTRDVARFFAQQVTEDSDLFHWIAASHVHLLEDLVKQYEVALEHGKTAENLMEMLSDEVPRAKIGILGFADFVEGFDKSLVPTLDAITGNVANEDE